MNGFELNKIAAAVLVAGLVALIAGKISHIVYHPKHPEQRGFAVDVPEQTAGGAPAVPQEVQLGALLAAADAAKGEEVAKKCAACHTFDAGGANKVGPNLHGIIGSTHAHKGDFAYSAAMAALKGETWDYEKLYHFINNPKVAIKGTKMAFAGVKKPEDIANLLAYLRSQGGSLPLPSKDLVIK